MCSSDLIVGTQTYIISPVQVRVRQDADDVSYQVLARGKGADAGQDAAVLRDYFNLDIALAPLSDDWACRDSRFAAIREYIPGVKSAILISNTVVQQRQNAPSAFKSEDMLFERDWMTTRITLEPTLEDSKGKLKKKLVGYI